ncbi:hypothetical protein D8674_041657 [Pyrus ussuriensis x Pyrus communis]|uniref:Uncharacterized protein n=1 Tax=Pyrus ussuriensis x Pyrus communis TaxID=2448454 RepID=A0A5N5I5J5_9ROSA|nr:hypothetical protein D8674_041657 [Pyrus ussuriensis x Pyrus communis]
MFHKFLNVHKLKPFSRRPQAPEAEPEEEGCTSTLKIVHIGGGVEKYYMATPAAKILEKHPSFLLARPEVFRRPWDSVVKPNEILTPGEKVLLIPHRAVRKLRRKVRKPNKELSVNSFVSQSSMDVSTAAETILRWKQGAAVGELSDTSICSILRSKRSVGKKHVTFTGIDVKHHGGETERSSESSSAQSHRRKRRVRSAKVWQPSLIAITETRENDHVKKYE